MGRPLVDPAHQARWGESAKDIEQRVLIVVCRSFEKNGPPPNERGTLVEVMRREIANHKRAFRPDVDPSAEVEAELSPATDPEGRAAAAEERAHLERYLALLPEQEAAAVRAVDLEYLTLDEAAAFLGRPRSTVAAQRDRGWDKLHELAQAPPGGRGHGR
jgi:RNA polymerase sigma factor (sigma-70 family)